MFCDVYGLDDLSSYLLNLLDASCQSTVLPTLVKQESRDADLTLCFCLREHASRKVADHQGQERS